jgi:uncharacterized membrane protein YphA (DoxX/SURF4 family)
MPPLGLVRAFVMQWWTAGIVFLYLSVKTVHQGLQPGSAHDPHLILVGGAEALAALLFLIPRTLRIGAIGLLVIFAAVLLIHALRFELRGDLLVYGCVVSFVAVHGPVPVSWLRSRA